MKLGPIWQEQLKQILEELIRKGYLIRVPGSSEYCLTEKALKDKLSKGLEKHANDNKISIVSYYVLEYIKKKWTDKGLEAIGVR